MSRLFDRGVGRCADRVLLAGSAVAHCGPVFELSHITRLKVAAPQPPRLVVAPQI